MIRIDLITGFLGAGKTTFLRQYAAFCADSGERVCLLVNDHGAVNVDMMLLSDLEADGIELEMVAGGCDADCHRRRFKTKLIAMGMSGYDRVIVEPSGIFDIDEFFDVLHEDPLDRWYETGSVIAIADAFLPEDLSDHAKYLIASETADAGVVVISRVQMLDERERDGRLRKLTGTINDALSSVCCDRCISSGDIVAKDWEELCGEDFCRIRDAGFVSCDFEKHYTSAEDDFDAIYIMDKDICRDALCCFADEFFDGEKYGHVYRIKGFFTENGKWMELNAVKGQTDIRPVPAGQKIIIVIGEGLVREEIERLL